ncbi:MAG: hypothetical protein K2Y37_26315 [Pirellulales bacterium]|nr:hypothetical protein [Pirellulales bacterium]
MMAVMICVAALATTPPTPNGSTLTAVALTAAVPERVQKYLERCEALRAAELKTLIEKIDAQAARNDASAEAKQQLAALRQRYEQLRDDAAPLAPLPLPVSQDELGVLPAASFADPVKEQAVDVLEVVDEDDLIVRAWYPLPAQPSAPTDQGAAPGERTFVDLWIRGVDTAELSAGNPATLPQVFAVTGNQSFDTDCGKRVLPRLEPIEVERFRSRPSE